MLFDERRVSHYYPVPSWYYTSITKSTTVQVYTNVDSTQVLVLYLCTPALLETYTYKYLSRIESRERSVREGEVGLERTFQVGRARVGSEGGG